MAAHLSKYMSHTQHFQMKIFYPLFLHSKFNVATTKPMIDQTIITYTNLM